ncbi:MAG TPA: hypothetical protein VN935_06130 [Rhizomicrobium sp.]|nr:hypothetical protein [Rhizomicrobium sp.]
MSAATLLASQQVAQAHAKPAAGFAQALEKAGSFQPSPLKQTASAQDAPTNFMQPPKQSEKLGSTIDIKI